MFRCHNKQHELNACPPAANPLAVGAALLFPFWIFFFLVLYFLFLPSRSQEQTGSRAFLLHGVAGSRAGGGRARRPVPCCCWLGCPRASRPGDLQIPQGNGQQHSPPLVVALCASYSGGCYVVAGRVSRKGILSEAKLLPIAV